MTIHARRTDGRHEGNRATIDALEPRVLMNAADGLFGDEGPGTAETTQARFVEAARDPYAGNRAPVNRGDFDRNPLPRIAGQYRSLQRRIVERNLQQSDIKLLKQIITDPAEYDAIRISAQRALNGKAAYYDELYHRFVSAKPNAEVLYEFLAWGVKTEMRVVRNQPQYGGRRLGWRGVSIMNSALHAYEGTGQTRFLDLFVQLFDEAMRYRGTFRNWVDVYRGRATDAWTSFFEGQWRSLLTQSGRFGYTAGRFALIVKNDPALKKAYGAKANEYVNAVEAALAVFNDEYKVIKSINGGYYERGSFGDTEPMNHVHVVGNAYVMLHALTGKEKYKQRVEQIANFFLATVERHQNGSWSWGYQPTPNKMRGHEPELVIKAEVTVSFPALAHHYGLAFTDEHMDALVKTLTKNVHRGDSRISDAIGPEFTFAHTTRKPIAHRLSGLFGFMALDDHDPDVRDLLETIMADRHDLFPGGWMHDWRSMEVYAYRMLEPGQHPAPLLPVANASPFSDRLIR